MFLSRTLFSPKRTRPYVSSYVYYTFTAARIFDIAIQVPDAVLHLSISAPSSRFVAKVIVFVVGVSLYFNESHVMLAHSE